MKGNTMKDKPFFGYEEPGIALAELATAAEEFLDSYKYCGEIEDHLVNNPVTGSIQTIEMAIKHYQRCAYGKPRVGHG